MIIKEPSDRKGDIEHLQSLLEHPNATSEIKERLTKEIKFIQAGIKGEKETAYEMEVYFGASRNWAVIHDLRVEYDGLSAQIDHLMINRFLEIWVCESKRFSNGVSINERGEFSTFYKGKPYGIPSPIEQNDKHIVILKRIFENQNIGLPKRLGFTIKPSLKGLILVSKNARITRPKQQIEALDCVIKNDQLFKTINRDLEESGPLSLAKVVSPQTLEDTAFNIAQLHKPITFDWKAKFGLPTLGKAEPKIAQVEEKKENKAQTTEKKSKYVCHSCGVAISYHVAKFCWYNKPRFNGDVYCRDCQGSVDKTA